MATKKATKKKAPVKKKSVIEKYWLQGLITLILITFIWHAYNNRKNPNSWIGRLLGASPSDVADENFDSGGFTVPDQVLNKSMLLSIGSSGAEVAALQQMINNAYQMAGVPSKKIIVDGSFGNGTQSALMEQLGESSTTLYNAELKYKQVFG